MSEQSEEKALQQGHECAMSALTAERERIASLNPADRLHWWLGFVAAAMGAALSSVEEPAFRVLRSALGEEQEEQPVAVPKEHVGSKTRQRKKGTYIKGTMARVKKA
jgi:hypothetical protein